jgi:hypothetical protein
MLVVITTNIPHTVCVLPHVYAKIDDMMKRGSQRSRRTLIAIASVLGMAVLVAPPAIAFAQQASSTNYSINEAFFGTGGQLCDPGVSGSSTNYCAKSSVGELGVGNTSSTNYQAQGGGNTNREEYIEMKVTASSVDLGILSVASAATTTGVFSVKSYLASGYVVVNASDPPKSGSNFLTNLTSPTASSPGTEQFGINLVANTSPSVGAAAAQIPSSTFSFGAAATGYNTANQFKYVKGDTIASSTKSSGETDYTVSYLYNISTNTKAGVYTFNHIMVATSTY